MNIEIHMLSSNEWEGAYSLIRQLRDLEEAEFIRRLQLQDASGYSLSGAYVDGVLVGLMGMRPVHTLARGLCLHIDDLIVDENMRGQKIGQALLAYAEQHAKNQKMKAVLLDARKTAIGFYQREGFDFHPAPSMWKAI